MYDFFNCRHFYFWRKKTCLFLHTLPPLSLSLCIYTHSLTYIYNCLSAYNDLIFSMAKKVVQRLSWQNTKALSLAQVCVLCNLSLQACCFTLFFAFPRKINFKLFQVHQLIHMDVFKHQLLEKYQVL